MVGAAAFQPPPHQLDHESTENSGNSSTCRSEFIRHSSFFRTKGGPCSFHSLNGRDHGAVRTNKSDAPAQARAMRPCATGSVLLRVMMTPPPEGTKGRSIASLTRALFAPSDEQLMWRV